MRYFRFIYSIDDCSIAIADPYTLDTGIYTFNFVSRTGNIQLRLQDIKGKVGEIYAHQGLCIEADAPGANLKEAEKEARLRLEVILGVLSFQENASIGLVQLQLGYEISPEATITEFLQVSHLDTVLCKKKRSVDPERIQLLGQKIFEGVGVDKRIIRAIRWYRKALIENDPTDKFMFLWLCLENIDRPLADLLGGQMEVRYCAICGGPYEVQSAIGIIALFSKYSKNGQRDFQFCRNTRVDLQHGRGDMESIEQRVEQCSEICRDLIRKGIYLLLGLDINESIGKEPIYNVYPPRFEHSGFYMIAPKDLRGVPILNIEMNPVEGTTNEGKRFIEMKETIDSDVPADVSISTTYITEAGIEVSMGEIKEVRKKK